MFCALYKRGLAFAALALLSVVLVECIALAAQDCSCTGQYSCTAGIPTPCAGPACCACGGAGSSCVCCDAGQQCKISFTTQGQGVANCTASS